MARPSKKQVAERELKERSEKLLRKRYEEQESKRAPLVQIDQRPVLYSLAALAAVTFISTAALVANGTYSVSKFIGLPVDWLGWLVFGSIEVAVLWSLLTYLLLESRGERSAAWYNVMLTYSATTITVNAFHTFEFWGFDWLEPRMWAGAVLSTMVPLSFVLVTKALSRAVFAKAVEVSK